MSFAGEASTIGTHWKASWITASDTPRTPTAHDNATFNKPKDGSAWVRLTVLPAGEAQADMAASPRYRGRGVVKVQIFTAKGEGDADARELADHAAAVFRGRTVSDVTFEAPEVTIPGDDGAWFQVNVTVPYFRDTIY